jgi:hypothetical protein
MAVTISESERYVAVLDILGFTNLLSSPDFARKVLAVVRVLVERRSFDGTHHPYLGYIFVSDTIIILAEKGHSRHLLWKISQVQNSLLKAGFATRGGITFGPILLYPKKRPQNIFGETYVKAYRIESSHAFYPRVVISSGLENQIRSEFPGLTKYDYPDIVATGEDGASYVRQFSRDVINRRSDRARAVKKAQDNARLFAGIIEKGFNESDERGKLKWKWLETEFKRDFPDVGVVV